MSRRKNKEQEWEPDWEDEKEDTNDFCTISTCKGQWFTVQRALQDKKITYEWNAIIAKTKNAEWLKYIRISECGAEGDCGYYVVAKWMDMHFDLHVQQKTVRKWFTEVVDVTEPGALKIWAPRIQQEAEPDILKLYKKYLERKEPDLTGFQKAFDGKLIKTHLWMDNFVLHYLVQHSEFTERNLGFISLTLPDDATGPILCGVFPTLAEQNSAENVKRKYLILYNHNKRHWQMFGISDQKDTSKNEKITSIFTLDTLPPLLKMSDTIQQLLAKSEKWRTGQSGSGAASSRSFYNVISALPNLIDESSILAHCKTVSSKTSSQLCQYAETWKSETPCQFDEITHHKIPDKYMLTYRVRVGPATKRLCLDIRSLKRWLAKERAESVDISGAEEDAYDLKINGWEPILFTREYLEKMDSLVPTHADILQDIDDYIREVLDTLSRPRVTASEVMLIWITLHYYMRGIGVIAGAALHLDQHSSFKHLVTVINKYSTNHKLENEWIRYAFNGKTHERPTQDWQMFVIPTSQVEKKAHVIVEKFGITIHDKDLLCLRDITALNDQVVNFYFQLIQQRSEQDAKLPKCKVLSSFFYSKLIQGGSFDYAQVQRWLSKVTKHVFALDMLLIPINLENVHWALVVVNMTDRQFEYYDSLFIKRHATEVLSNVKRYMIEEINEYYKDKDSKMFNGWKQLAPNDHQVGQQDNEVDCGVFMCMLGKIRAEGKSIRNNTFDQKDVPLARQQMMIEIQQAKLL